MSFHPKSFHPKSFHPNVQFFNTFAALPATAPANHAHIIDFGKTGTSPAMLQDAVVTLLYSISPETLTAFLKPDITSFRLLQKHKDPKHVDKFIVMKKGSKVLVGVVTDHPKQDTLEFDNLVRFTIKEDGIWDVTNTSYRDYFRYDWEGVWAGQTVDRGFAFLNLKATPGNDPEDYLKLFPAQLASIILREPIWDATRFEWTIIVA